MVQEELMKYTLTHIHTHTEAHYWWRSGIILKGERSDARSLSRKLNPRSQLTPRLQLLRLLRILKDSLHKQHKPTLQFITATALIFSILNENLILNSLKTFRITRQWSSSGELRKSILFSDARVWDVSRFARSESLPIHSAPVLHQSPSGLTICFDGNQLFFLPSHLHSLLLRVFCLKFPCDHGSGASDGAEAWSQRLQCLAVPRPPWGSRTVHNRIPLISPKVGLVWGCWKLGWKLQSHVSLLL